MSTPDHYPSEMIELGLLALEHGIDSIADKGGPLIPFVLTVNAAGERDVHRYVEEPYEAAIERARQAARDLIGSVGTWTVAYDGFVTDPQSSQRLDAIITETAQHGVADQVVFAQPYRAKRLGRGIKPVGPPTWMGAEPRPS